MMDAEEYTIRALRVSSMKLMENAAKSCVKVMKELNMDLTHVCVVCGFGNNGGDGFAIARLLISDGYKVTAVLAGDKSFCTAECKKQMKLFKRAGGKILEHYPEKKYSVIIDAIFGIGLNRNLAERHIQMLEKMNASKAVKLAVDIPTGISADTGYVFGAVFKADYTVTFQAEKFGMKIFPGKEYVGKVFVADIGISTHTMNVDKNVVVRLEKADYRKLLPKRKADSHKGTYGRVLVIAGSKGMCGAAYFNAKSAYMAGAGLVKIYTAEENRVILQQLLPEAVVVTYKEYNERELKSLLLWADVICMGSGTGTREEDCERIRAVLSYGEVPCVIDADGLTIISLFPGYLELMRHEKYIFTPHVKEMARLTDLQVSTLKKDPLKVVEDYSKKARATCVLKDAVTLIAKEGKRSVLNTSGNSAMAKAGSGDILAGILVGYLAQGLDTYHASVLGVYIHGRAGDLARKAKGCYSVMAEDIISQIGPAMNECAGSMEGIDGEV